MKTKWVEREEDGKVDKGREEEKLALVAAS